MNYSDHLGTSLTDLNELTKKKHSEIKHYYGLWASEASISVSVSKYIFMDIYGQKYIISTFLCLTTNPSQIYIKVFKYIICKYFKVIKNS